MNDWQAFVESVPWFLDVSAAVCVLEPRDGFQLPLSVDSPSMANTPLLLNVWEITISLKHVGRLDGWSVGVGRASRWAGLSRIQAEVFYPFG